MVCFSVLFWYFLASQRETTKNLIQDSQPLGRDMNPGFPECEARSITTQLGCYVMNCSYALSGSVFMLRLCAVICLKNMQQYAKQINTKARKVAKKTFGKHRCAILEYTWFRVKSTSTVLATLQLCYA